MVILNLGIFILISASVPRLYIPCGTGILPVPQELYLPHPPSAGLKRGDGNAPLLKGGWGDRDGQDAHPTRVIFSCGVGKPPAQRPEI